MRIHDITVGIAPGMAIWPGDPPVERRLVWKIGQGSTANVSHLSMSVHSGTHVDAPIHYIPGGASVESLPLDALVGPCQVCEIDTGRETISAGDLEALGLPAQTQRLLVKTSNSALWGRSERTFQPRFVSFSTEAARWIVDHGIRLVGIDYLSVEPLDAPEPVVHRTLLAAGVIPLEGVNLSAIVPGEYMLVCLPLKLAGSDGSPARVILMED